MFANYDTNDFPQVTVTLGKTIRNTEEYESFTQKWEELYTSKKDFFFIIDARMTGFVLFKYAYKMRDFINKLKSMEKQYLKHSIIIIHNSIVEYTLRFIFSLVAPVAPVYLVYSIEDAIKLNNLLIFPRLNYLSKLNKSDIKNIKHVYIPTYS